VSNRSDPPISSDNPDEGYTELGHLVRQLHETLRELGYDRSLQDMVGDLPETQDRLSYIATLTEQAATRTLNAIEVAIPLQEDLEREASALAEERRVLAGAPAEAMEGWNAKAANFLEQLPGRTQATNAQLQEIMLAQDFQDLTGQVIKKVTVLAKTMEQQLVHILLLSTPPEKQAKTGGDGLLNGPVVKKEGRSDIVNNQKDVDDLLDSLGF